MNTDRVAAGLEKVRTELEAWRRRRHKGERIPEAVWRRAAGAVRPYGLNAVSRALRLDYYQLKRRASRSEGSGPIGPTFVELSERGDAAGQRTAEDLACVVELAKGNGTRMRICVRDVAGVDWGKVKEAFLGA